MEYFSLSVNGPLKDKCQSPFLQPLEVTTLEGHNPFLSRLLSSERVGIHGVTRLPTYVKHAEGFSRQSRNYRLDIWTPHTEDLLLKDKPES